MHRGAAPRRAPSRRRALGHLARAEAPGPARGGSPGLVPAARNASVYAALPFTVLPEESGRRCVPASTRASLGSHRVVRLWSRQLQLLRERRAGPMPSHQTPRSRRQPMADTAGARRFPVT